MLPMVYIPILPFDSMMFSPALPSTSSSGSNWESVLHVDMIFLQLFIIFYSHNFKRKEIGSSSYEFVWCFLVVRFQLEYHLKDVVSFAGPPIWRLTVPICSCWHSIGILAISLALLEVPPLHSHSEERHLLFSSKHPSLLSLSPVGAPLWSFLYSCEESHTSSFTSKPLSGEIRSSSLSQIAASIE